MTTSDTPSLRDRFRAVNAIAVDTNALGGGDFSPSQVSTLVNMVKSRTGTEIWIAEPVVWEWAEHLHRKHVEVTKGLTDLRKMGYQTSKVAPLTVDEAVDLILEQLHAMDNSIKILPIANVAGQALKDQILVKAPGERKTLGHAKTGASDSAIFRAYHDHAQGDESKYVLLSGDSDVKKAFGAWGLTPPHAISGGLKMLRGAVFKFRPTPVDMLWKCRDFLNSGGLTTLLSGSLSAPVVLSDLDSHGEKIDFSVVGKLRLVGLDQSQMDTTDGVVSARVLATADVEFDLGLFGFFYDRSKNDFWFHDGEATPDCLIIMDVVFTLKEGLPVDVTLESIQRLDGRSDASISQEDGLEIVLENLRVIPGMSDFDWYPGRNGENQTTVSVNEADLVLVFGGDASESWTLDADYCGEWVKLEAEALNDGSTFGDPSQSLLTSAGNSFGSGHLTLNINSLIMLATPLI